MYAIVLEGTTTRYEISLTWAPENLVCCSLTGLIIERAIVFGLVLEFAASHGIVLSVKHARVPAHLVFHIHSRDAAW